MSKRFIAVSKWTAAFQQSSVAVFCAIAALLLSACSTSGLHTMQATASPDARSNACDPYNDDVRESVIRLANGGSTASGVVVAKDRVLTVAHAIDGPGAVTAEVEGYTMRAKISAVDKANDLAILEVPTGDIPAVRIASRSLQVSEPVWAVGFPLASAQRVSEGIYDSVYNGRLYSNVHINSGTSGGGLLRCDDNGSIELAGIVHGYIAKSVGSQLVNIGDSVSVPVPTIKRFINTSLSGMMMDEDSRLLVEYN